MQPGRSPPRRSALPEAAPGTPAQRAPARPGREFTKGGFSKGGLAIIIIQ